MLTAHTGHLSRGLQHDRVFIRDEMIRSSHDTIRIDTKGVDMVIFDTIRYDTDKNGKNTNIHNSHILLFMNTMFRGMLRLVSFTNTVTRFTQELDKTNLIVKLKKTMHI